MAKAKKRVTKKITKKAGTAKKKGTSDSSHQKGSPSKAAYGDFGAHVAKKYKGRVLVQPASEVHNLYALRRSTGILSLDIATGGGIPAGGVTEVYGPKSAGKTMLAYRVAAQVQRVYGEAARILIWQTEDGPDVGYARSNGFCIGYSEPHISRMQERFIEMGEEPFNEEEFADLRKTIGTVDVHPVAVANESFDVALEAIADWGYHLVIMDSLGALLTEELDEKNVGERVYAGSANLLTPFFTKLYKLYNLPRPDGSYVETTLLCVNQARANMDAGLYGPKHRSAAGAYAFQHAQLLSIEVVAGAEEKVDKVVIGKKVRWKLAKGKAGAHDGRKGEYFYKHLEEVDPIFWHEILEGESHGVDHLLDAFETAKSMDILEASGAWFTWKDDKGKVVLKTQGGKQFADRLREEPELFEKLREQCLRKAKLYVKYQ